MEALPPDRILQTEARILASDLGARNAPGGRALGIVEDGITLVEHPLETFRRGVCRDKPIVLGSTRDESRMWFALGVMTIPDSKDVLAAEMERFFQGKGNAIFASYHARYPDADLAQLREQFLTDAVYRLPAVRTALAHADSGGAAICFGSTGGPPATGPVSEPRTVSTNPSSGAWSRRTRCRSWPDHTMRRWWRDKCPTRSSPLRAIATLAGRPSQPLPSVEDLRRRQRDRRIGRFPADDL